MINKYIKVLAELNKLKITVAVSVTTIMGYIVKAGQVDTGMILPTVGIFILACGSSVINHFQERSTDALMKRTRNRPIPSGRITPGFALLIGIIEIMAGSLLLYIGSNLTGLVLGLLALIWYNLIYTNLKKVTRHAVIPGSIIGSIPPLVGWVSAGGSLAEPEAWLIGVFFFIWQVPHFMLLAIKYADDYKSANFPNIMESHGLRKLQRDIFYWILATVLISLVFPFTGIVSSWISITGLLILSVVISIYFFIGIGDDRENFKPITYFKLINYYVLLVTLLICTDQFIR
jgi:heme o synthase